MPHSGIRQKALQAGAFFIFTITAQAVFALCGSDRYDETIVVEKVHDGDTVNLADGRKVRLIGINTPELARDNQPAEPYAKVAKDYLQGFANQTRHWRVRWGKQRKDHYGRWLGHVFVGDNNLNAEMLRHGLASVIAIPPNQWSLDCYRQQEVQARLEAKGIWGKAGQKIWQVGDIPASLRGYQFIQGRVDKIISTKKSIWLQMSPLFSIRIARDDMQYFDEGNLYNWRHRKLEVRGWVSFHKGRLQTRIKHPAAVHIIE